MEVAVDKEEVLDQEKTVGEKETINGEEDVGILGLLLVILAEKKAIEKNIKLLGKM